MQFLKTDTSVKVVIGPVVAVGDGFTPVTTLSLSTADEAEILKHDAAAVTDISSNTFAAITGADGYYNLTITAGQLDTEGMLTVLVNDDSLCLPVRHDFMVVAANVFDSLFAASGTDLLDVQVGGMDAGVVTAAAIATDAIGAAELATDAVNEIRDAILSDSTAFAGAAITEARLSELDAATAGKMANQVDEIRTDTGEIGAAGAGLTAVPWNASWDAEVQSEVNDALVALGLDHLVSASVIGTDIADNSIIARMVASGATADWDTFVNTTDSLQAIRDHIGDGTNLTEAGGNGDHLTEAGGTGDHLTAVSIGTGGIDAAAIAADAIGASELAADAINEIADGILTRQMTESYAANGVAPTVAQAFMGIHQMLMSFAISGTSITVRQLNNTTTAFIVTLDDGTNPTTTSRA